MLRIKTIKYKKGVNINMGTEKVLVFGKFRKLYYDKKGKEWFKMPTKAKFGVTKGTKMYMSEYAKAMGRS